MDGDHILDAAGELFARHGIAAVGMNEIATAAGCSRATLYRYFDCREALHTAYVHREARAVSAQLAQSARKIADPHKRLLNTITRALKLVRENPALSAWFAGTAVGAEAAVESEVVTATAARFLRSLGDEGYDIEDRARWLVRVIASLLLTPGRDADDERRMLASFVAPLMVPSMDSIGR